MKYDVLIIGGGASGLCCAVMSKKTDNSVLIIEKGDRVGKKILSTGNGRCNLTNAYCMPDLLDDNPEGIHPFFSSGDVRFADSVIGHFNAQDTIAFFESLGVLTENKDGYIYPRSEQASTVLNALRLACERKGVEIITGVGVNSVKKISDPEGYSFLINGKYRCRKCVISAGGMAAPKTGSDGSMFKVIKGLGHTVIKPMPALCGINCSGSYFKELQGVRNNSVVTLMQPDGKMILRSAGNLQFTRTGISGIPVFQLSSEAGKLLDKGTALNICIDLLPEIEEDKLAEMIDSYCREMKEDVLPPVLNNKLLSVCGKAVDRNACRKGMTFGQAASAVIKKFIVTPVSLFSFDEAQTTAGGVSTEEIDVDTMESKIMPGLFFTGEVIDVNGICGGYNLQWAWATANMVSKAL